MTTEKSLLKEIESRPYEVEPWLVYCDWLEENGSSRSALIREQLQHRLPPTASELERYKPWAIAANKSPSKDEFEFAPIPGEYKTDVDAISKVKIFRNFPRDLDGRLPLKRQALLSCPGNDLWSLSRQKCLIVRSPERRRATQCLTVTVENIIIRNQAYNWSEARWLWDRFTDPPKSQMKPKNALFKNAINAVQQLETKSKLTVKQRHQLSTHLLDLGRHREAFELFGIHWDESLNRVSCNIPFVTENPTIDKGAAKLVEKGQAKTKAKNSLKPIIAKNKFNTALHDSIGLREQIWFAAPWKLKATIDRIHELRKSTMKTKKRCHLRLFAFPKQSQSSKRAVFIGCDKQGENHRIYSEHSGSNDRLPLVDWQRDFWFDMERLELV